ncbi:hypothetical protein [Runella sp.]|uniref:hypothetical protein n=1 Tax=Runella sp. TaxID=1960881 RepID=UPI003D11D5E2
MTIPEELKKAIIQLPQKEKDRLLLRLIAKDKNLVLRLEFELIEMGDTVQSRRDSIKQQILKSAQMTHNTPGWMMMDMRNLAGDISQHLKITKDKYGEIELMIYLLLTFFEQQSSLLLVHNSKSDSVAEYIAKKTDIILKKLAKFDPDYYVDFERDMQHLLNYVHSHCPKNYARQLDIPKNWP